MHFYVRILKGKHGIILAVAFIAFFCAYIKRKDGIILTGIIMHFSVRTLKGKHGESFIMCINAFLSLHISHIIEIEIN